MSISSDNDHYDYTMGVRSVATFGDYRCWEQTNSKPAQGGPKDRGRSLAQGDVSPPLLIKAGGVSRPELRVGFVFIF